MEDRDPYDYEALRERSLRLLEVVTENPGLTLAELRARSDLDVYRLKDQMSELDRRGEVRWSQSRPGTEARWYPRGGLNDLGRLVTQ